MNHPEITHLNNLFKSHFLLKKNGYFLLINVLMISLVLIAFFILFLFLCFTISKVNEYTTFAIFICSLSSLFNILVMYVIYKEHLKKQINMLINRNKIKKGFKSEEEAKKTINLKLKKEIFDISNENLILLSKTNNDIEVAKLIKKELSKRIKNKTNISTSNLKENDVLRELLLYKETYNKVLIND